ncbi:MAG: DUF4350 domain-containing protein [Massilia sp.]
MKHWRPLLIGAVTLLIAALGLWWWQANMERRVAAVPRVSEAARRDRMLVAARLLRANGHPVQVAGSLAELPLDRLPGGTVLVGDGLGIVSPKQAALLLAWVGRGNTLVTRPRWINPDEHPLEGELPPPGALQPEAELPEAFRTPKAGKAGAPAKPQTTLAEVDPIAALLGVRLTGMPRLRDCKRLTEPEPGVNCQNKDTPAQLNYLLLPGAANRLELGATTERLIGVADTGAANPLLLRDQRGVVLRVYQVGQGHIAMLADNYFDNGDLRRYDHGELLLALADLNQASPGVTIIKHFNAPSWQRALWNYASLALISVAAGLALLLWRALARFGPPLPAPAQERRSLIEHIRASGAWLWKADGGPDLLLAAARDETLALIRRRAPGLLRAAPTEINAALAAASGLPWAAIDAALHQSAAPQPARFTSQIRTLQTLRNHYERN